MLTVSRLLTLAKDECLNNVPWIKGRPTDIYFLDDENDLKRAGITLHRQLKRTDYYIHWNNQVWALVEKKKGPSRIDTAIEQLKSTLEQLQNQGRKVDRLIVVAEKFSPNEKTTYGRVMNKKNLLYLRKSSNKNSLPVKGINLEFYTFDDMSLIKQQERIV